MNILDFAHQIGLQPRKMGCTNGGEYKSACPNCQMGHDRFCIWPNQGIAGKYWCRQCHCHGDAIQFCRDFLKLTYFEACSKVNVQPKNNHSSPRSYCPFKKSSFEPKSAQKVSEKWKIAAKDFIENCHQRLLSNPDAMQILLMRGLTIQSIKNFRLGWHSETIFDERTTWGLPHEIKENGNIRKQWLPKGIVIPAFDNNEPTHIKVRRADWHPEDKLPKYVEIAGSLQRPSFYGDRNKPVIVLESELDAILIQQLASDLCCCIALGGVSKRPDNQTHEILRNAPLILLALDYDEAGKKEYSFWMSLYPNLRPWPAGKGKSIGDSFQLGVDLHYWVERGLSIWA